MYGQQNEMHLIEHDKDFEQFIKEIGPVTSSTLCFNECNKFIKLKAIDYIPDSKVVAYYRDTFSK